MFCPKCGTNNPEKAFSCSTCGAPLQGQQGGVQRVSMPDGNQLRFANPGGYTPAPTANYTAASAAPAPKKSHKKAAVIILSCIGGFLVLCAALVLIFLPQLERAVLGETVYYLYRETDTVKTLLSNDYVQALAPNKTFSATTQITAEASSKSESPYAQSDIFMLKKSKINAQIDYNAREKKAAVDLSYLLKDKTVASARLDAQEGAIGVSLPKLADGQLVYRADLEMPTVKEVTGYSETKILGMLKDIGQATEISVGLQDKTVTGKEVYNGQNCRYTEITVDEEDLIDIYAAALDAFLNNPDAVQALKNAVAYESAYYKALENDLQDLAELADLDDVLDLNSDDILDDLKEARDALKDFEADSDTKYTFKIYYTSRGDIVSRTFTVKYEDGDTDTFVLDTAFDSKKTDILFTYSENWEYDGEKSSDVYTFTLTAEKTSGKLAGTAKLVNKFDGETETYFTADFADIAVQKCGGLSLLIGQINVKIPDGEAKISLISTVSGNQNTITGKCTSDSGGNYETAISVTVVSELSKSADVSDVTVADKSTMDLDEEAIEKIAETVSEKAEDIIGSDLQDIYDSYYESYYDSDYDSDDDDTGYNDTIYNSTQY